MISTKKISNIFLIKFDGYHINKLENSMSQKANGKIILTKKIVHT